MRREKARCRMFSTAASKQLALGVITLACFLALSEPTAATPVYSQNTPSEPGSAFSSRDTLNGPIVADNFKLNTTEPVAVRSLRFIGGYGSSTLPVDDFRVVFLEDSGGIPGIAIPGGDLQIGSANARTPTGGQLLNGVRNPIEFVINFDSGVVLSPDTEYWISITNSPDPDNGWVWARANGELDDQTAVTFSDFSSTSWVISTNGGMWFELGDQIIPEPTSIVTLLITLCASVFFRWQRCR